jgi:hypothetical protein
MKSRIYKILKQARGERKEITIRYRGRDEVKRGESSKKALFATLKEISRLFQKSHLFGLTLFMIFIINIVSFGNGRLEGTSPIQGLNVNASP